MIDWKKAFRNLALFAVGLVPGFFIVFNLMLSDVLTTADRLLAVGMTFAVYAVLGAVAGLVWPRQPLTTSMWLFVPALLAAVYFVAREPSSAVRTLSIFLASMLGTVLGALAAAWWRLHR